MVTGSSSTHPQSPPASCNTHSINATDNQWSRAPHQLLFNLLQHPAAHIPSTLQKINGHGFLIGAHTKRRFTKRRITKRRITKCRLTKCRLTKSRQDKTSTVTKGRQYKTSTWSKLKFCTGTEEKSAKSMIKIKHINR
jgi:hypothetical protein